MSRVHGGSECEVVLDEAVALRGASLVIHRHGMLVEFKTDLLVERLSVYQEGRFHAWQVGSFEGHHVHPDLKAVRRICFDAEPVSCQGGRLNPTVWFLADRDCGNPYRPEGLFSVTLNEPYDARGHPRMPIIEPMYRLYERFRTIAMVTATDSFIAAGRRLIPA